ncbi:MAG: helix-turn-helix transcriptional regulator [Magnetococcales bacterium]|nr:helix-turn-helix transcriptional regulator [Magnetococcales bacterium]
MDNHSSIFGLLSGMDELLLSFGFESWVYSVKILNQIPENAIEEVIYNCNHDFMDASDEFHTRNLRDLYQTRTPDKPTVYNPGFLEERKKLWKDFRPESRIILDERIAIGSQEFRHSLTTLGKYGEKGIIRLRSRNRKKIRINDMTSNVQAVNVIFPFMHTKYIELKGWKPPGSFFELTERELECLRWAAAGKTSLETGVIMNITERTVKFHLVNAQKKLMSKNKTQAVARAILYNYL